MVMQGRLRGHRKLLDASAHKVTKVKCTVTYKKQCGTHPGAKKFKYCNTYKACPLRMLALGLAPGGRARMREYLPLTSLHSAPHRPGQCCCQGQGDLHQLSYIDDASFPLQRCRVLLASRSRPRASPYDLHD